MLLTDIVLTSQRVAETGSKLRKADEIAKCLARTPPDEIEIAAAMLAGYVRQGKIGIGYAQLRDARSAPPRNSATLSLSAVDEALARLANTRGAGSATEKKRILRALLDEATEDEQDFLVRLLIGELRQGATEGLLVDAIAKAAGLPSANVRRAAMLAGDIAVVARTALSEGEIGLSRFAVTLFRPLQPMLAQPALDVGEALALLQRAAFEWKLDGARVQVHKAGDKVAVYSRSLNEVTHAVPEVVALTRALPVREAIFDGEVIALRPDGTPHPFQITMRRFGRKLDVVNMQATLPLSVFFFDCLYSEGESLLDQSTEERFRRLREISHAQLLVERIVTDSYETAQNFFKAAIERGHEGLVAKSPSAFYEAGNRGTNWLKIKRAHTLDLVILAAEWGNGRRRGWLSNLHLGARDPNSTDFVMLGKTFKGMTDKMLEWQTQTLLSLEKGRDAYTVYVRPELVVEIAFNDIQASPHYEGGLALRFARVKRYRTDKTALEADTIDTVRALFAKQNVAS